MKALLFTPAILLFMLCTAVHAQKKPANTTRKATTSAPFKAAAPVAPAARKASPPASPNPFKKGTISITNRPMLDWSNFKGQVNGDPKDFSLRIDPSYFFADGIAVGIDYRMNSNSSKNLNSSYKYWQADLTLTYGRKINNQLNAYIKLFAGPGQSHSEFTNAGVQKLTAKYFDIKGLVGFPFAMSGEEGAYFTPYVTYDYYTTTTPTVDTKEKSFAFGFKLESYLNKNNAAGGKEKLAAVATAYKKGAQFLEINNMGGLSFARRKLSYANGIKTPDQKTTSGNLSLGGNYFFLDNFAAGLNISVNGLVHRDYQNTKDKSWQLMPVLTAHAPLKGNGRNLFLQAGYGIGGTNYSGLKKSTSDLVVKAGYNLFLTKMIALTPKIGYEQYKTKVPSGVSGIPTTDSGPIAEIGVRAWVDFRKGK